ncbi:hypothetical protein CK203_052765 [Vitis vinifera]|uniref:Uncharacterized protein n=1 Tax=Vitis vinifera TaxID=29760 RepID=A0A438FUX3_VITVI|nr:hypothetical protein CK203_052765 [Vitis vinifera]
MKSRGKQGKTGEKSQDTGNFALLNFLLQHHLGLPSATEHLAPTTTVPHSETVEPHAPPEPATEETETST